MKSMRVVSVNVGLPRTATWWGKAVTTGIFKTRVNVPVMVRRLNLDGDKQADPSVHGGINKAVYVTPPNSMGFGLKSCPRLRSHSSIPHLGSGIVWGGTTDPEERAATVLAQSSCVEFRSFTRNPAFPLICGFRCSLA
jgi:hypothetical protein